MAGNLPDLHTAYCSTITDDEWCREGGMGADIKSIKVGHLMQINLLFGFAALVWKDSTAAWLCCPCL